MWLVKPLWLTYVSITIILNVVQIECAKWAAKVAIINHPRIPNAQLHAHHGHLRLGKKASVKPFYAFIVLLLLTLFFFLLHSGICSTFRANQYIKISFHTHERRQTAAPQRDCYGCDIILFIYYRSYSSLDPTLTFVLVPDPLLSSCTIIKKDDDSEQMFPLQKRRHKPEKHKVKVSCTEKKAFTTISNVQTHIILLYTVKKIDSIEKDMRY